MEDMNGIKFGAFAYLAKPCNLDDLIRIIFDACKQETS